MTRRFSLLNLFIGLTWPALLHGAETGQIVGQLVDVKRQITYAGGAAVFLCDAQTSYPIHRKTKRPIQFTWQDLPAHNFWHAVTDDKGVFQFDGVPVGRYRLVAQSWSGTKGMPEFMGNTSAYVTLHGVAENVEVKPGERTKAYPRQLGNGMLRITNDPAEANAFLLVSLKPTLGDAILGPHGWGNEFVSQLVGVTHMAQAQVTISGLPDDHDIHVALFNYDNLPGFGSATFKTGQRDVKLRIVAAWSNGHHHPPPELKELTDHLADNKLKSGDFLHEMERAKGEQANLQKLLENMLKDPQREVDVRGLGKRRLIDVLAALGYVELRAFARK